MRITFVVNQLPEVHARQTTFLLAAAAVRRGHDVFFAGVLDLGWADDRVRAHRRPLTGVDDADGALARCAASPGESAAFGPDDLVLIRTNPGRAEGAAAAHATALSLLSLARRGGVRVLNDPDSLMRQQSKLNTLELPPSIRVPGIVTADADEVRRFVAAEGGPCVLKPLVGTRGRGVHLVQHGATPALGTPLDDALAALADEGPILAQRKAPGAEAGDTRVVLAGGEVLRVGEKRAAVRRVPPAQDFRSNIAVGGAPAAGVWSDALEHVAREAGPWLRRSGIWLAGLDVIGGLVIEVNVFSTGGLFDASRLEGVDFADAVVARLETDLGPDA
jgi:glutathione synthase